MKLVTLFTVGLLGVLAASPLLAQTLYVPGGTVGTSSNDKVGIGTSAPRAKLHTYTATPDSLGLTIQGTTINGDFADHYVALALDGDYGDGTGNSSQIRSYSNLYARWGSALSFHTTTNTGNALVERMRITAVGNVGVGTANPAEKLDVTGNIIASGDIVPGGHGVLRGITPIAMHEGAVLISSMDWVNVTRTTYTDFTGMFSGVPVLPGAVRKFFLVIRKADNQPGGVGSHWRFRMPWVNTTGHGFSLTSDWGSLDEGNMLWIEVPPDYYGGAGSRYWTVDARMATNGPAMRVFSVSLAAVDARGQSNVGFTQADNGPTTTGAWSVLGGRLTAYNDNLGVGTTSPSHKLTVNGTIRAKEVIVDTGWADYVFADDYRLAPLTEVEAHIKEHKHLPGIPSASQVAEQGVSMGEMQARMMAKIEELTLHVIRLEKENTELRKRMQAVEAAAH